MGFFFPKNFSSREKSLKVRRNFGPLHAVYLSLGKKTHCCLLSPGKRMYSKQKGGMWEATWSLGVGTCYMWNQRRACFLRPMLLSRNLFLQNN